MRIDPLVVEDCTSLSASSLPPTLWSSAACGRRSCALYMNVVINIMPALIQLKPTEGEVSSTVRSSPLERAYNLPTSPQPNHDSTAAYSNPTYDKPHGPPAHLYLLLTMVLADQRPLLVGKEYLQPHQPLTYYKNLQATYIPTTIRPTF